MRHAWFALLLVGVVVASSGCCGGWYPFCGGGGCLGCKGGCGPICGTGDCGPGCNGCNESVVNPVPHVPAPVKAACHTCSNGGCQSGGCQGGSQVAHGGGACPSCGPHGGFAGGRGGRGGAFCNRPAPVPFAAGPPTAQVTYPYYTNRGPRDFLARQPRGIGR